MSTVNQSEEFVNFTGLPYPLYYLIFSKFDYKQFAVFEESCEFAYSLCSKNQQLKFDIHTPYLMIYESSNYHRYYDSCFNFFGFSVENCPYQVKVIAPRVRIEGTITAETLDFLVNNVEEFSEVELKMPKKPSSTLKTFFQKVAFKVLHLHTTAMYFEDFCYDTSKVKKVIVSKCGHIFHKAFFSIEAEESVTIKCTGYSINDIVEFIKEQIENGPQFAERIIHRRDAMHELQIVLMEFGPLCGIVEDTIVEQGKSCRRWAIARYCGGKPIIKVEAHSDRVVLAPWV